MAMLSKAAEKAKKGDESKKDEGPKKKKKHPATSQAQSGADQDQAQQADAGDEAQPDAQSQGAEQDSSDDGAGAATGQDSQQGDDDQDQGGDAGPAQEGDGGAQQPGGQGQQAATPVPNPAAPGAGDDTSGGDDTSDNTDEATGGTPDAGAASPAGSPSAMGGPGASSTPQVPMNPAMQEEYDNLNRQLVTQLYQGGLAEHILPSLQPQGPNKIRHLVQLSVVTARELMLKNKAPLQLALPFGRDCAAHIAQLGEQVKQIQYSDQELTAIFGGVYEGMLHTFGVKKSQLDGVKSIVPRSQFVKHLVNYRAAHGHAQAAMAANHSQAPAQAAGPQGPQGAPPAAGAGQPPVSGGGPPGGAAPVGAGPGAGGALSAGMAAAAPQGQ